MLTSIFWIALVLIYQHKDKKYVEITFMDGSKRSSTIMSRQFGSIYTEFGKFRFDENGVCRNDIHSEITLKIL